MKNSYNNLMDRLDALIHRFDKFEEFSRKKGPTHIGKGRTTRHQLSSEELSKHRDFQAAQLARSKGLRKLSDLSEEDWKEVDRKLGIK